MPYKNLTSDVKSVNKLSKNKNALREQYYYSSFRPNVYKTKSFKIEYKVTIQYFKYYFPFYSTITF